MRARNGKDYEEDKRRGQVRTRNGKDYEEDKRRGQVRTRNGKDYEGNIKCESPIKDEVMKEGRSTEKGMMLSLRER